MPLDRALFLCGPTASGKSRLAVELAKALNGEIVNGDAFQLYRGAPVITAAPDPADSQQVPHHLYGVLDPSEACDAMRYRELALPILDAILSRNHTPIVTGGSGLYLKFLTHGPSPVPTSDPDLRAELNALPTDQVVARLQDLDPVEAARTDLANRRYVIRALEICLLAERPCSELRDRWECRSRQIDASLLGIFIQRERPDLHQRIARRTEVMVSAGALDEVRNLDQAGGALDKAIGVPQIRAHLAGETDLELCRKQIEAATRQYAKRQETWFRREKWMHRLTWKPNHPPPTSEAIALLG